jgi:hypothetical protein
MNFSDMNSSFMSQNEELLSLKSFNNCNQSAISSKAQSLSKLSVPLSNLSRKKVNVPSQPITITNLKA